MQNKSASEKALEYFSEGVFNCAQSVLGGHLDNLDIDESEALKLASGFGGGMRCGEVCGALTGGIMALGAKYGYFRREDAEGKAKTSELVIELESIFKNKFGSILCKDLLDGNISIPEEAEKIYENNITIERCPKFVAFSAEVVEKIMGSK